VQRLRPDVSCGLDGLRFDAAVPPGTTPFSLELDPYQPRGGLHGSFGLAPPIEIR